MKFDHPIARVIGQVVADVPASALPKVVAAWLLLRQGRLPESCTLVDGIENDLRSI